MGNFCQSLTGLCACFLPMVHTEADFEFPSTSKRPSMEKKRNVCATKKDKRLSSVSDFVECDKRDSLDIFTIFNNNLCASSSSSTSGSVSSLLCGVDQFNSLGAEHIRLSDLIMPLCTSSLAAGYFPQQTKLRSPKASTTVTTTKSTTSSEETSTVTASSSLCAFAFTRHGSTRSLTDHQVFSELAHDNMKRLSDLLYHSSDDEVNEDFCKYNIINKKTCETVNNSNSKRLLLASGRQRLSSDDRISCRSADSGVGRESVSQSEQKLTTPSTVSLRCDTSSDESRGGDNQSLCSSITHITAARTRTTKTKATKSLSSLSRRLRRQEKVGTATVVQQQQQLYSMPTTACAESFSFSNNNNNTTLDHHGDRSALFYSSRLVEEQMAMFGGLLSGALLTWSKNSLARLRKGLVNVLLVAHLKQNIVESNALAESAATSTPPVSQARKSPRSLGSRIRSKLLRFGKSSNSSERVELGAERQTPTQLMFESKLNDPSGAIFIDAPLRTLQPPPTPMLTQMHCSLASVKTKHHRKQQMLSAAKKEKGQTRKGINATVLDTTATLIDATSSLAIRYASSFYRVTPLRQFILRLYDINFF